MVSDISKYSNMCYNHYVNKHLSTYYEQNFVLNALVDTKISQTDTLSIRSLDSNRRDEIR